MSKSPIMHDIQVKKDIKEFIVKEFEKEWKNLDKNSPDYCFNMSNLLNNHMSLFDDETKLFIAHYGIYFEVNDFNKYYKECKKIKGDKELHKYLNKFLKEEIYIKGVYYNLDDDQMVEECESKNELLRQIFIYLRNNNIDLFRHEIDDQLENDDYDYLERDDLIELCESKDELLENILIYFEKHNIKVFVNEIKKEIYVNYYK